MMCQVDWTRRGNNLNGGGWGGEVRSELSGNSCQWCVWVMTYGMSHLRGFPSILGPQIWATLSGAPRVMGLKLTGGPQNGTYFRFLFLPGLNRRGPGLWWYFLSELILVLRDVRCNTVPRSQNNVPFFFFLLFMSIRRIRDNWKTFF